MFNRILFPADLSPFSSHALAMLRSQFPGASVRLLHVIDPKRVASTSTDHLVSPVRVGEVRKELEADMRAQLARLAGEQDEIEVVIGKPVEQILKQAELWQPDLVFMGTHGRTGMAHFLQGSVAEEVVRLAKRPVLVIPERETP
jgi:nucleotide-binding universal stress UspA family protein